MVTVIVKYQPSKTFTRDEAAAMLRYGAEKQFLGMPHLYSKQFCFDADTNQGLSSYLWESREHAEAFFSPAFLEMFQQQMGCTPEVAYYDNLVTVDNRAGEVLS